MIIPRHADLAGDVVIARRQFHAGAGGLLADGGAIKLLPRRLMGGIGEAAFCLQLGAPLLHFLIRDQDVGAALVEVDANLVAGFEDRKAPVGGSLRSGVEDRRRAGGAGLAAVADAGQRQDAAFDEGGRRLHVHDLGTAGIADRAGAAYEEDAALVNVERRIVDPRVIIFRTFEYDGAAFERVRILRIAQIAVAEFPGDHAGLHDRGIKQIAAQHQEARVLHQRLVVTPDHIAVGRCRLAAIDAHGAAVDGHGVFMDALVLHQFAHHRRHAAGAVIFLAEIETGRLHVHEQRHIVTVFLPVVDRELDADMAGKRVDVDRRVGRAADRRIDHDAVFEGLSRQDVGRLQILPDHPDNTRAGVIGDLPALAIGSGDGGASGQRHAERFGQRIHGRGGAHRVAMADRGRRGGHDVHELLVVDPARGKPFAGFPDHGTGAGPLAVEPAVQHRAAREHDRRQVDGRGRHQTGRGRLVAAGGQDHAVEGIAEQDFDQAKIGEVAVECRGRAFSGLLDRMGRKFHRDAAGGADSFPHPVGQLEMMPVARRKVVAGLRNADDRLAGLQFLPSQAIIEVAFEVERGHARIMRVVEPFAGAEFAPGDAGERFVHDFSRSAHALFIVRHFLDWRRCLHADAPTATAAASGKAYDFDPTTSARNSAKTPSNEKSGYRAKPVEAACCSGR
jgi:hypothetical protein